MQTSPPSQSTAARAEAVLTRLRQRYPQVRSQLVWRSPWELLVATVLAAQCTDTRVNAVTPVLFAKWPTIQDLAQANSQDVEEVIRSTGLFRSKARNLTQTARTLVDSYDSQVPNTMQDLLTLPGVARKTANIVLSQGFEIHEGIAVDTHVKRLSFRLGLTRSQDPAKIERGLMPLFPRSAWGEINHLLVWFGREVCQARSPMCRECNLADICPREGVG
ncbi:MAG: endonuclease III [Desulfovermiculus sp.]|nr:endonuclease III [Desulfovermiculus sp.]